MLLSCGLRYVIAAMAKSPSSIRVAKHFRKSERPRTIYTATTSTSTCCRNHRRRSIRLAQKGNFPFPLKLTDALQGTRSIRAISIDIYIYGTYTVPYLWTERLKPGIRQTGTLCIKHSYAYRTLYNIYGICE